MVPSEKKVVIDKERCKGCELCVVYCPRKSVVMSRELNAYGSRYAVFSDGGPEPCNSCGFCYLVCPEVCVVVGK